MSTTSEILAKYILSFDINITYAEIAHHYNPFWIIRVIILVYHSKKINASLITLKGIFSDYSKSFYEMNE